MTSSSVAPMRWLTVAITDGANSAGQGAAALRQALDEAGIAPTDVVHLKLWTPTVLVESDLAADWFELFEDRAQRPSVSLVQSPLADGLAHEITVAAAPGAGVRAVYEADQPEASFPRAASAGDAMFVSTLVPNTTDADAAGQAEEVFGRLRTLLERAGADPTGVGHIFVWYADHSVRDVINEPYLATFATPGDRPARHSVVRELPPGVKLMIEVAGSVDGVRSSYTVGGLWHGGIGGVPNSLPFGTRCGDLLYSAGTYGRDPSTGEIPDDLSAQTEWALHYSHEFLRIAGVTTDNVRQIYVWIRNEGDTNEVATAVRTSFAADRRPISIQLIRAALPGTNQIQIELVAQATPVVGTPHDALS